MVCDIETFEHKKERSFVSCMKLSSCKKSMYFTTTTKKMKNPDLCYCKFLHSVMKNFYSDWSKLMLK